MAALPCEAQEATAVRGCALKFSGRGYQNGLNEIPVADGTIPATRILNTGTAFGGAERVDSLYYLVQSSDAKFASLTLKCYNLNTLKQVGSSISRKIADNPEALALVATDVAYDATTDAVYGCFYKPGFEGYTFGTIDYELWTTQNVSDLATPLVALAIDAATAKLYGLDNQGILYTINKTDGVLTRVGDTGLSGLSIASAAIDPEAQNGATMYLMGAVTGSNGAATSSHFYNIDLATAQASEIASYDKSLHIFKGLYIPAPLAAMGPKIPANLSLNFPDGALSGTVNFNLPALHNDDTPSTDPVTWHIIANGNEMASGTANAGTSVSVPLTVAKNGNYKISVYATNDDGRSAVQRTHAYIGVPTPAAPQNVRLMPTPGQPEYVTLTWDPVTTDSEGQPLDASLVSYNVYLAGAGVPVATGNTTCEFTAKAVNSLNVQQVVVLGVRTVTSGGQSATVPSNRVFLGDDYSMPYHESFDGDDLSHLLLLNPVSGSGEVTAIRSSDTPDVKASDADNAYLTFQTSTLGNVAEIISGKISLSTATTPSFYFDLLRDDVSSRNTVEVLVVDPETGDMTSLQTLNIGELPLSGWNPVMVNLDPYIGQTINIALRTTFANAYRVYFDNTRLVNAPAVDLGVTSVSCPEYVEIGENYTLEAAVSNLGRSPIEEYTVEIYRDGSLESTTTGNALASGGSIPVSLPGTATVCSATESVYQIKVHTENDVEPDNDASASHTLRLVIPSFPQVKNLTATKTDGIVHLEWEEPDLSTATLNPVTESFEAYEPWCTYDFGQWQVINLNQELTIKFLINGYEFPTSQSDAAFWILDNAVEGLPQPELFAAHTGTKSMCALQTADAEDMDKWAISPRLSGRMQKISFYVRSYMFGSRFEVLYSTADKPYPDENDFQHLASATYGSATWARMDYYVPDGVTYFAIRCTSRGARDGGSPLFFVDDFTYTPEGTGQVSLLGYNVYRDGVKLNTEPLTNPVYNDNPNSATAPKTSVADSHEYGVSALYDGGESMAVKLPVASGLDVINDDSVLTDRVPVYYNLQGQPVSQPTSGLYLRVCGSKATKVVL